MTGVLLLVGASALGIAAADGVRLQLQLLHNQARRMQLWSGCERHARVLLFSSGSLVAGVSMRRPADALGVSAQVEAEEMAVLESGERAVRIHVRCEYGSQRMYLLVGVRILGGVARQVQRYAVL